MKFLAVPFLVIAFGMPTEVQAPKLECDVPPEVHGATYTEPVDCGFPLNAWDATGESLTPPIALEYVIDADGAHILVE